ncbi:MAG: M20/M25/M40 family metallo-hydrolase [Candidatus Caldarchaeum sp.]
MKISERHGRIRENVESERQKALDDLAELISIPSVSARNQSIDECANFVKQLLERDGFSATLLETKTGRPAVYAEKKGGKNTILLYNHYDVQPPEPLEEWQTDPFKLTEKDGILYGRGVSDNKGEIIARLAAVRVVEKAFGLLPLTVKWIIEGEEEVGSPGISDLISRNRSLFGNVVGCMWEGGDIDEKGPTFYLGVKGMLYVELNVRTAKADAHSMYAPIIENAAEKMVRILRMLKDDRGVIRIPGFYADVLKPTAAERRMLKTFRRTPSEYVKSLRVNRLTASRQNLAEKIVYEPTCNVAGFSSGYSGPGSKTIVPSSATVKIDFRLVPNQDPAKILRRLKNYLPKDVEITVQSMSYPARVSPENPLVKAAVDTAKLVYVKQPAILPNMPGTGPIYHFVKAGIPTAMLSVLAHPGSRLHAPNENIYLEHFVKSIEHHSMIFTVVGGQA